MFVAETGEGLSNANSLCAVEFADTYHAERGNIKWGRLSTTEKQQRLIRATDHMSSSYRERWLGWRVKIDQGTDFPRYGIEIKDVGNPQFGGVGYYLPADEVPKGVQQACAEFALLADTSDSLAPQLTQGKEEVKIGPLQVKYNKQSAQQVRRPKIVGMLAIYLSDVGGGATVKLVRG